MKLRSRGRQVPKLAVQIEHTLVYVSSEPHSNALCIRWGLLLKCPQKDWPLFVYPNHLLWLGKNFFPREGSSCQLPLVLEDWSNLGVRDLGFLLCRCKYLGNTQAMTQQLQRVIQARQRIKVLFTNKSYFLAYGASLMRLFVIQETQWIKSERTAI